MSGAGRGLGDALLKLLDQRRAAIDQLQQIETSIYLELVNRMQGSGAGLLRPYESLSDQVADLHMMVRDLSERVQTLEQHTDASGRHSPD
jgi:hypothetical protein